MVTGQRIGMSIKNKQSMIRIIQIVRAEIDSNHVYPKPVSLILKIKFNGLSTP